MAIRVSQVLNAVIDWKGKPPVFDTDLEALCEQCDALVSLGGCRTEQTDQGLEYRCQSCPELLVIVSPFDPGAAPMPGKGFRLGQWVIRNVTDLFVRGVRIDLSRNAAIKN